MKANPHLYHPFMANITPDLCVHYAHVLDYLRHSESEDLYQSMEENQWSYEEAMNYHVLGRALCVASLLGMLEGAVDKEIQEILESHGDYRPAPEGA